MELTLPHGRNVPASWEYSGQEVDGTRKVLGAAALTYVAAVAVSLLQLLRLVLLFGGRRDDD
ncbi:MAG: zinc metallopeptidase [Clostridium sp.]